jgi:hypothetical protein
MSALKPSVSRSVASENWIRKWFASLPSAMPRARQWQNWRRYMASLSRHGNGVSKRESEAA